MKSRFKFLFPIFLIAFIISCRDSSVLVTETGNTALFHVVSVKEAKDEFGGIRHSGRVSEGSFWSKIVPLWDFAFQVDDANGLGTYLVVPTKHDPFLNLVKDADGAFVERKSPPIRLIVFKDKKGILQSYYYVVNENRQKTWWEGLDSIFLRQSHVLFVEWGTCI